MLFVEIF